MDTQIVLTDIYNDKLTIAAIERFFYIIVEDKQVPGRAQVEITTEQFGEIIEWAKSQPALQKHFTL